MAADIAQLIADAIDRIYEAGIDPSRWLDAIKDVSELSGGFGGALSLWDTARDQIPFSYNQAFPDDVWREYGTDLMHDDPLVPAFAARPNAELYTGENLIDAEMNKHDPVRRYIRRYCDQQHAYGARLFSNGEITSVLMLSRNAMQGPALAHDLARLRLFVPHLRRSILIGRRLNGHMSDTALDALSFGVVALDRDGTVMFANRAMQQIAADQDGITLGADGISLATASEDTAYRRELDRTLKREFLAAEATQTRTALTASRPSGKHVYVIVIYLCPNEEGICSSVKPAALVCVADPAQADHLKIESIIASFGLTPAQAALAAALLRYGTLSQAAAACRLTPDSARQYLKRIFERVGVASQVELVTHLTQLLQLEAQMSHHDSQ